MPTENVSSEKRSRDRALRKIGIEGSEKGKGNLKEDPSKTEVGRKLSRAVSQGLGGKQGLGRGALSITQMQMRKR